MDQQGRAHILEATGCIYQCTSPPAFQPGEANNPADGCKEVRNRLNVQPVRRLWNSQTSQLLLTTMLPFQIELRHEQSGGLSHRGDFEAMATLSRGSQSQDPTTVRPQESPVFPNIKSALLEASEMG